MGGPAMDQVPKDKTIIYPAVHRSGHEVEKPHNY
jgi:hypothetical protein